MNVLTMSLHATVVSPRTTVGVFLRQAERFDDRPLLHYFRDQRWQSISWAAACEQVRRIAARLIGSGLRPGSAVIILAENRPEWILCDLAIQAAGAITVPIYPSLTPATAQRIVRDCGAELAIVSGQELAQRLAIGGELRQIVDMDREMAEWTQAAPDAALLDEVSMRLTALRGADVATVIYTSGTTGEPKGAVIPHESMVAMAEASLAAFELRSDDVLLSFLPYSHVFERISGIFVPIAAGASIWISRGADYLVDDISAVRPTLMMGVPRVFEKVVDAVEQEVSHQRLARRAVARWVLRRRIGHQLVDRFVIPTLRRRLTGGHLRFFISGGAPLTADVEDFFWRLGVPIYQGWGLTETTSAVSANRPGERRAGTVGKPLPGVEVKAVDDGELLVRGPGVMRGYLRNPEATAEVFADGWLKTGDIGTIDADGYITITDRKKDLIKTAGGKFIAPQPLEARLQRYRYIAAAMLVGDQRPYVAALILPAWGPLTRDQHLKGTPEQLVDDERVRSLIKDGIDALNRELASFETIKRFRLVSREFTEANGELTPSQKIKRRVVQQRYQRLIDEMYSAPRLPEAATAAERQRPQGGGS
jgi:long-chain acyl-CoA synthetase